MLTPERAAWLLAHPLDRITGDPHQLDPYKTVTRQPDGSLLTCVLAIDR